MIPPVPVDVPYALELTIVTETQVPVAGKRTVVTRSYAQVDFERGEGEGGWLQKQKACAVVIEGGRVTFPETFVDSIPAQSFPVTWGVDGYTADPGPTFTGMDGPATELPDDPEDPRVTDQDADGHPGVTVYMDLPVFGRLEMYIVQAAHSRMQGSVTDGRIEGSVEVVRMDQETLGASMGVFARTLPTRVLPGRSSFRIVPDPQRRCQGAFDTP